MYDWEIIIGVVKALYEYSQEQKKREEEKEQLKSLVHTLTTNIHEKLTSLALSVELSNAKISFENVKDFYNTMHDSVKSQGVPHFLELMISTRNYMTEFINDELDKSLSENNVHFVEDAYTLHCCIDNYLILTYTELNKEYGYQLDQQMLICIEEDLALAYRFERSLFQYYFDKHPSHKEVPYWRDVAVAYASDRLMKFDKLRKILENVWLNLKINPDPNFNKTNPEIYGGFNFDWVTKRSIVSASETQKWLAVNDKDKRTPNTNSPSILRDLLSKDINFEKDSEIKFEVIVKSEKMGRQVEIVIWELGHANSSSGVVTMDNQWQTLEVRYQKKYDDSNIRCEVYWKDDDPTDLLIQSAFIKVKKREYNEYLGTAHNNFLYLWAWRPQQQRCKDYSQVFDLNHGYNSAQFIAADNYEGDIENPSVLQNIQLIPSADEKEIEKEIIFECFIRNETEMIRKVEVVIWELGTDGPINENAKSAKLYEITSAWKRVSVTYKKQQYKSTLRFEIYWHDKENIRLIVDNLKIYHPN